MDGDVTRTDVAGSELVVADRGATRCRRRMDGGTLGDQGRQPADTLRAPARQTTPRWGLVSAPRRQGRRGPRAGSGRIAEGGEGQRLGRGAGP